NASPRVQRPGSRCPRLVTKPDPTRMGNSLWGMCQRVSFPLWGEKRQQFDHQVGQNGWGLLAAIQADPQTQWMLSIPAVDTLERIWKQDYLPLEEGGTWIADENRLEAAKLYYSP